MHFYLITDDLMIDIVGNPLPLSTGGGGLNHLPSFQKGGLDRTLIFKGGWLERGGGDLFIAMKYLMTKMFINKNVFLCHNKEFKLGRHFADLRGAWQERGGVVFLRGGLIPQSTL